MERSMTHRIITGSRALLMAATLIMVPALPLSSSKVGVVDAGGAQTPEGRGAHQLT